MKSFHDYMKEHRHSAIMHPVLGPIVMVNQIEYEDIQKEAFDEGACGEEPINSLAQSVQREALGMKEKSRKRK